MASGLHQRSRNSLGFALVGCSCAGQRHAVHAAKLGCLTGTWISLRRQLSGPAAMRVPKRLPTIPHALTRESPIAGLLR
jgi:hypothetical protein